jgi:hypothetical protein
MRRPRREVIEFPANPFVALADFVMVLLLVLILTSSYLSLTNSRLLERSAVALAQKNWNASIRSLDCNKVTYANKPALFESDVDGDLQRFRINGRVCYAHPRDHMLSPDGHAALVAFGNRLAQIQADDKDLYSRPFKRIYVNGHADRSEGDEASTWQLSLERANEGAQILINECHIYPDLVEISANGTHKPAADTNNPAEAHAVAEANRRLDIVVVYSGENLLSFYRRPKQP